MGNTFAGHNLSSVDFSIVYADKEVDAVFD